MIKEVLKKIPSYYLFRKAGRPRMLPMSITASVTYRCNSRCKTCNIHERHAAELSTKEWSDISKGLGTDIFWITMSGGEPFLRDDLAEIVSSFNRECRPSIINIPTNGLLPDVIYHTVERMVRDCGKARIVVNVSIDHIGAKNDEIRGVPGGYDRAVETFEMLKSLGKKVHNLSVGIHTVISRYNVSDIPQISDAIRRLNPDSYITEIAEEREELLTVNAGITPDVRAYAGAVGCLNGNSKADGLDRIGSIARAFRKEYYEMTCKVLMAHRQVIPCYAGFASAQIAPDGDVWMCCTRAESIGNLRDGGYDFQEIWHSPKADLARRRIRAGECYCPLANVSYTNMLFNLPALARVGLNFLRSR